MRVHKKSLYDYIIEEGMEKGVDIGIEQEKEMARQRTLSGTVPELLELGLSIEQIAEALNLDVKEIM